MPRPRTFPDKSLLQLRVDPEFTRKLDEWRGRKSPILSKTKAVQALVEQAWNSEKEQDA